MCEGAAPLPKYSVRVVLFFAIAKFILLKPVAQQMYTTSEEANCNNEFLVAYSLWQMCEVTCLYCQNCCDEVVQQLIVALLSASNHIRFALLATTNFVTSMLQQSVGNCE